MTKKKSSSNSRREFIKKKVIGGLVLSTGLPFIKFENHQRPNSLLPNFKLEENNEIDWGAVRKQFLMSADTYHFNTASLGPSPEIVINTIYDEMNHLSSIPNDGHKYVEKTHNQIADFLNITPEEIAITRNATESMNIVARSLKLNSGDEVILTTHEHIGGSAPWINLQNELGIKIKLVELNLNGENNLDLIKSSITNKTKVVSFSHVTCTTGLILPAQEIIELCRSKGIYSCVDGAQALGMIPIDLNALNPDFYVASCHKWMFGPMGTGILFVNKNIIGACSPVFVGAFSDSKFDLNTLTLEYRNTIQREEYGTRNTPVLIGLGQAFVFMKSIGIENIASRGRDLAKYFRNKVADNPKIEFLTPSKPDYSASIITIRAKEVDNLILPKLLFDKGKYLRVRGIYENDLNAIRISFSMFNNSDEIDYLISTLNETLEQ